MRWTLAIPTVRPPARRPSKISWALTKHSCLPRSSMTARGRLGRRRHGLADVFQSLPPSTAIVVVAAATYLAAVVLVPRPMIGGWGR